MKIAGWALGLSLAVAGIGAAVGTSHIVNGNAPTMVKASEGDTHDMGQTQSTSLNNNASIPSISIPTQPYYVKKVTINCRYNKTINPAVTIEVTVGGVSWGTVDFGTDKTEDVVFQGDSTRGEIEIAFTNHCGSGTKKGTFYVNSVVLTEGAAPAAANPITSISDVTLSKTTVPVNYSKTISATAIFAPAETDELLTWTSSNKSVATIEASTTLGEAFITVVGEGTCYFTASNASGSITHNSPTFTVTEAEVRRVYEITFSGTGTDSDATTDAGANIAEKMLGDGSDVTVDAGNKVYNGKHKTIKFSSSKENGSMTISTDSDAIKAVVVEASGFSGDASSLSVKVGTNSSQSTGTLDESEFKYYVFNFATAGESIVFTATKRVYLRNIALILDSYTADQGIYNYGASLVNTTAEGCAELNASKLASAWSTLNSSYSSLDETYAGAKAAFKNAEADINGTLVEKAAARYDYIVGKYLKVLGNEAFADFAARNPAPVNGAVISRFITPNNTSMPMVVTVAALGTAAAAGFFLFQRKRKEN